MILDCKQAFENPFIHPQTGTIERISSFYAVTAGSVGTEALQHYFNSLFKLYGANARLLQAKGILILDRWASASHRDRVTDLLTGLLVEFDYNERHVFPLVIESLRKMLNGTDTWPLWRLRSDSASAYLRQPFMPDALNVDNILNYWRLAILCNKEADLVGQGILNPENRKSLTEQTISHLEEVQQLGIVIRGYVTRVMQTLGPLSGA